MNMGKHVMAVGYERNNLFLLLLPDTISRQNQNFLLGAPGGFSACNRYFLFFPFLSFYYSPYFYLPGSAPG